MKEFIITIDTEGDNLWEWREGKEITTKNVEYLQRFQNLCNQFGFKPVWLSNWEMITDDNFVSFIKNELKDGQCELGMHLHAWNTPPFYKLPSGELSGPPYLIEYPTDIMEKKIEAISQKFQEQFGFIPKSHRAGRWAISDIYISLLEKYGYTIDCSVTPGINWNSSAGQTPGFSGTDYSRYKKFPYKKGNILEIPVTTVFTRHSFGKFEALNLKKTAKKLYNAITGRTIWLRPNGRNLEELLWIAEHIYNAENDYLMFMLHSSELMPAGSPTFQDKESIEKLYHDLNILFQYVSQRYIGVTLEEYAAKVRQKTDI